MARTPDSNLTNKFSWPVNGHKDRLKYPLIRKNGVLQRASWDEAMNLVAEKAKDVKNRLTAHGIGFYTTGQLFLEEYYALAMVGKAGLNTLHMSAHQSILLAQTDLLQGWQYQTLYCHSSGVYA